MEVRKITREDLALRVEWMNDASVFPNMGYTPPIELERTYSWFEAIKNDASRFDAAFVDDEGRVVGFGGLTHIDALTRKAEFYLFIGPDFHRRGFGTKAAAALCRYGFEELNLHKVFLYANASNTGARHTYEKIGFKMEGVLREEKLINGRFEDRLYYGIFAHELLNF